MSRIVSAVLLILACQHALMAQSAPTREELIEVLTEASDIADDNARLQRFDEIAASLSRRTISIPGDNVGKWQVHRTASPIDDSQTIILSLHANSTISAWPNRNAIPSLLVRYKEGTLDCYINLGVTPHAEHRDRTTATIRFDQFEAEDFLFGKSTDGKAIFFHNAKTAIERMAAAETMVLRFTPFNSSPVTTTFTLTGLANALKEIEQLSGEQFQPWAPASLGKDAAEKALKRVLEQTDPRRRVFYRIEGPRFIFGAEGASSINKASVQRDLTRVLQQLRVELEKQPSWSVSLTAHGSTYGGEGRYSSSLALTTGELTAMARAGLKEARIAEDRYVVRSGRAFDPEFYDDPQFPTLKGKLKRGNDHIVIEITNLD